MRISSVGSYLPRGRLSNQPLLDRFSIDEEFLREKIGVAARAVKASGQRASDLCLEAFADLRSRATFDPDATRALCVVTQNPDFKVPHTAAIVHHKLGLPRDCMTFDVSQGCAGYVHGLAIASGLIERLGFEQVLLFTCDPYSQIIDPDDKNTALLFGDAATVTLLTRRGPGYRLVDARFGTTPGSSDCLLCDQHLAMNGRQVFLNATREVPESIRGLVEHNQLSLGDIDLLLLHPGSLHMIKVLRRALELDDRKVPFEMGEYGNTVSSSIPLMLRERIQRHSHRRIVMSGFGVGFSWGTCLTEWTDGGENTW